MKLKDKISVDEKIFDMYMRAHNKKYSKEVRKVIIKIHQLYAIERKNRIKG